MTIAGASPLHQALVDAIDAADADAFNALLRDRLDEIRAAFGSWTTIPAAIRGDDRAVNAYAQSLILVARAVAGAGEPALLRELEPPDESNIIVQWRHRFAQAQALSEAGDYASSNDRLNRLLDELEGARGDAVVQLRPKILGRLGYNALQQHDHAAALDFTTRAYDATVAAGDVDGQVAYHENLMSLRTIVALATEPAVGARLLAVRRLVVRAQDAADAGRYAASRALLTDALDAVQREAGQREAAQRDASQRHPLDGPFRALLPKIYGLLGFAAHKLGDASHAREYTALALQASEQLGDVEGVRVYRANLETLAITP